jgi:hypothetical protein
VALSAVHRASTPYGTGTGSVRGFAADQGWQERADELEGAFETHMKAWHLSSGSTTLPNL